MNDEIDPKLDEMTPHPPMAERVAKRAMILAAMGNRGLIENELEAVDEPARICKAMVRWIEKLGIGDEAEPEEWQALQRGPGFLESQAKIDAVWRLEGLGVLLWALGRYKLPPYDQLVRSNDLFQSSRLFRVWGARRLLARAKLRPAEKLAAYRKHALMTHWRLRNFRLHPGAIDFVEFSKGCWCGQFDIRQFRIVDNDLALGKAAIADADPALVKVCESIASQRHRAIDWVVHSGGIYSETDTST
jgi:hypothetical protein